MNKRNVFIVLVSALVIMICVTYQGTYSYFTAAVGGTGNTENNTSTGGTATLSDLILTNGDNIANTTMIPGDSVTITFTVENPNTIQVCFNLLWSNTENTFVNQKDLVYTLEDEDGTMLVSETQYPSTNTGTTMLLEGTSIGASETKTYTLTITYKETDEDQTADIGKAFSGSIIGELGECYVPPSYCEMNPETGACQILAQGETEELKFDNTEDNNLRYVGANPNNYVSFNNELWRIIGVFNNIDDGTGTTETRLKIIRNEPIGEYSWDNKPSTSYGSNDWTDSTLKEVLNNGPYWNRTSGNCPSGQYGVTTACDFTTTGLSEEAKSMISDAVWNLGGSSTYNDVTASMFYERERGTTVYSGHAMEWIGKIGLMYASDYGYATSGGSTTNREACLNKELYNWNDLSECDNNDWLHDSSNHQWTLTSYSSNSSFVFHVDMDYGYVHYDNADDIIYALSPTLYLNSNVKMSGGSGTEESPYTLSL